MTDRQETMDRRKFLAVSSGVLGSLAGCVGPLEPKPPDGEFSRDEVTGTDEDFERVIDETDFEDKRREMYSNIPAEPFSPVNIVFEEEIQELGDFGETGRTRKWDTNYNPLELFGVPPSEFKIVGHTTGFPNIYELEEPVKAEKLVNSNTIRTENIDRKGFRFYQEAFQDDTLQLPTALSVGFEEDSNRVIVRKAPEYSIDDELAEAVNTGLEDGEGTRLPGVDRLLDTINDEYPSVKNVLDNYMESDLFSENIVADNIGLNGYSSLNGFFDPFGRNVQFWPDDENYVVAPTVIEPEEGGNVVTKVRGFGEFSDIEENIKEEIDEDIDEKMEYGSINSRFNYWPTYFETQTFPG